MAWTAVYGSLMAADRALQAMSICCRMPKRDVLLQGALEPDPDVGVHAPRSNRSASGARVVGRRRPDPAERGARDDVLADAGAQADGHLGLGGHRQQQLGVDGLQVARLAGEQRHRPVGGPRGLGAVGADGQVGRCTSTGVVSRPAG